MNIEHFRRALTTFADVVPVIDLERGRLIVTVREERIEAGIRVIDDVVEIAEEESSPLSAQSWLINRIGHVPQLADRLLTYIPELPTFVAPSGLLLHQLDASETEEEEAENAPARLLEVLSEKPTGTSNVVYLTSDAGEGKTTVIAEIARRQALAYKEKRSNWLLVPIALGGRSFMRFDDIVVAALMNRFRFPFLYYDAFLELVRLGVLVPAFDGFEEVFIDTASGEGLSALGNLVNALRSTGTMLVAARKAYFEYRNFLSQAKLFDNIGYQAEFARLALQRWDKRQFLEFGEKRGVEERNEIYTIIANRLGAQHPMLTRAVLVNRVFEVAGTISDSVALGERIGEQTHDYFFEFINAIIEREANEKWLYREGEHAASLLTTDEHHHLLAMLAMEMWFNGIDTLRSDVLDIIADLFCSERNKSPLVSRQVKTRLKQHALIATADQRDLFCFDHDDFRRFFLGRAIAREILDNDPDIRIALKRQALPSESLDNATQVIKAQEKTTAAIASLLRIAEHDHPTSFTRENCGALLIRLLDRFSPERPVVITQIPMIADALRGREIDSVIFNDCYVQRTELDETRLLRCEFHRCMFESLDLSESMYVTETLLDQCTIASLTLRSDIDTRVFDPEIISATLQKFGFSFPSDRQPSSMDVPRRDERTIIFDRALRLFLRRTELNDSIFRVRLGVKAGTFLDKMMPELLDVGVIREVPYLGHGGGKRFRLAMPMQHVEQAIRRSRGNFDKFVSEVRVSKK